MDFPFGLRFSAACAGLEPSFTIDAAPGGSAWPGLGVQARLRPVLTNLAAHPRQAGLLRLSARLDLAAAGGSLHIQGRYMQRDSLVRRFGAPLETGYLGEFLQEESWQRRYFSRGCVALTLPARAGQPTLAAGALQTDRFFLDIEVSLQPDESRLLGLTLSFDLEGAELAPGEPLELPTVLLLEGEDPLLLLEHLAGEIGKTMAARVPAKVPTGWCSWYFFYSRVSEADVLANVETMARTEHPAEVVQIDDGFQSAVGDWLWPNEKFPSGMAALAEKIRSAGFRPGLWLAPLVLAPASRTLRERPELALRTHAGELYLVESWLGRLAVLDCTHPAAEQWLSEVVQTAVRQWGYSYLKLDALAFAAAPAGEVRYASPGTTAAQNLRRGLEIIRRAAGESTFILGCTCHFGPAIGLVDAMRVGPDVKEVWDQGGARPSVKHALRISLLRNFMHRRFWVNDPDCLIVRERDTLLNENEVRFLATGIALSGGVVVAGDDLPRLSERRRELALALFPPAGVAARPLDPAEGPVPSSWRVELGSGRALLGLLNWGDEAREVALAGLLAPGEVAFHIWEQRPAPAVLRLAPHEGALLQVTSPSPLPRVVGDSGHVAFGGLVESRVPAGGLRLRNERPYRRRLLVESGHGFSLVELAPQEEIELAP